MLSLWRRLKGGKPHNIEEPAEDITTEPQAEAQVEPPLPHSLSTAQLTTEQTIANQHQSPLFVLPAETRVVIWEYALGGEIIHIEHNPLLHCWEAPFPHIPVAWAVLRKEVRFACGKNWAQKEWLRHMNWHFTSTVCGKSSDGEFTPKAAILALLLSCKRIYMEAFPFLYTLNTFDFRTPRDFLCFRETLPPRVENPIRRIRMQLELSWRRTWAVGFTNYAVEVVAQKGWEPFRSILHEMEQLEEVQLVIHGTIPRTCLRELCEFLAEIHIRARVQLEVYGCVEQLIEVVAETGVAVEVKALVPWNDCSVVFATTALNL